jgi:hypothetical protein
MDKNFAKVQLSTEEMRLVTDPAWILTKNSVISKVVGMMAELSDKWQGLAPPDLAPGVRGPKISRGENYKGLPWVMLDYPRIFGKEDVFAIRTMFWWGHEFNLTLHLKGKYMHAYVPVIIRRWEKLAAAGFQVGISEKEWEHEHTPQNYRAMDDSMPVGPSFFKISARCGLEQWNDAPEVLTGLFSTLLRVLISH